MCNYEFRNQIHWYVNESTGTSFTLGQKKIRVLNSYVKKQNISLD